jgi:hypothetical protein
MPHSRDGNQQPPPRTKSLEDTLASAALNLESYAAEQVWMPCMYTIAQSQDKCSKNSWVFAKSPLDVSKIKASVDYWLLIRLSQG